VPSPIPTSRNSKVIFVIAKPFDQSAVLIYYLPRRAADSRRLL
jgi:hypothetical protein